MSYTMTMEQGPNLRSQDVRYRRMGGEQQQQQQQQRPYRDNPNAPASLQSFTRGGYGPADPDSQGKPSGYYNATTNNNNNSTSSQSCWHICCGGPSISATFLSDSSSLYYYRDEFNDMSWSCSAGTTDEHGIWLNKSDPAGTIMGIMVWILLGYSQLTIVFLAQTGGITWLSSWLYGICCCMALACHIKTSLTDPGSVPPSAVPTEEQRKQEKLSMCSQCQTFKPPLSHHCRICNRCISRMDHHCPWMNNCVGAGNMKHFFLFLIYTWTCTVLALSLMGYNYFFCTSEECEYNVVLTQLVRIMTILSICAFLFTSSMLMNVIYGLMTGIGTIDRLKKKATDTMGDSEEEPVPLTDVFGIGPWWTWPLPTDPLFEDYDRVMGYSTPQRLLREQILREQREGDQDYSERASDFGGGGSTVYSNTMPSV